MDEVLCYSGNLEYGADIKEADCFDKHKSGLFLM
jgi:hypothetical protein